MLAPQRRLVQELVQVLDLQIWITSKMSLYNLLDQPCISSFHGQLTQEAISGNRT